MNVGELFILLGVKSEKSKVDEFQRSLQSTLFSSMSLITSLVGVSVGLEDIIKGTIEASSGFSKFEATTGLSGEELQNWQNIAERANVSTGAVSSAINSLQQNIEDIKIGKGNMIGFSLLGIDPMGMNAFQVLDKVREAIKGMPRPTAVNRLQMLGINPEMIQLLMLTNKQMKDLSDPRLAMSDKQIKNMQAFRSELVHLKQEFLALTRLVVSDIAPAFTLFIQHIGDLVEAFLPFKRLYDILDDIYTFIQGGKSLLGEELGGIGISGKAALNPIGGAISKIINMPVTIAVNSAAPAAEVADHLHNKLKHQLTNAEMGLDNEGH